MNEEQRSPLVEVRNLSMNYVRRSGIFGRSRQVVQALDDVSLKIFPVETLGIVGESGCGKSTLARCLLRLIESTAGSIHFDGIDLTALHTGAVREMRQQMQIVMQNPFASLNPRLRGFDLVAEPLRTHTTMTRAAMLERIDSLLGEVGLNSEFLERYPHEMSGGQAQRIALARALALNPRFLILDEPTSALDVSVQAQIINLLVRLQKQRGLTYLFITHDLGVVQHIADRIAVMYLGKIVEIASSETIFENPAHPYTQALLSSTPIPDPTAKRERIILSGTVPSAANPPPGCSFHTRCLHVMERCRVDIPSLEAAGVEHHAACFLLDEQQQVEQK